MSKSPEETEMDLQRKIYRACKGYVKLLEGRFSDCEILSSVTPMAGGNCRAEISIMRKTGR